MVSWCTCCLMMGIYSTPPTVKFTRTWLNLSVTTLYHPHTIPILWMTSLQALAAQKPTSGNVCVCVCVWLSHLMRLYCILSHLYCRMQESQEAISHPETRKHGLAMFLSGWAVSKPGWPWSCYHCTLSWVSSDCKKYNYSILKQTRGSF